MMITSWPLLSAALAIGSPGGEVASGGDAARGDDTIFMEGHDDALGAPEGTYLVSLSASGSGCPPGSVTATVTEDGQLVIAFPGMVLTHPPGPLFQNINCPVSMIIHVPEGWQFSVSWVRARGFAHLPAGTWAEQRSSYFFAGNPLGGTFRSRLNGYFDGNYSFVDSIGIESIIWSTCGQEVIFTINQSLSLNTAGNRDEEAFINADNIDAMARRWIGWQWRRCV